MGEIQALIWLHQNLHGWDWVTYLFKYVTLLGETGAIAIATAVILLIFKKTRKAGVVVTVAFLLDVLLVNVILKNAVNRARPWTEYEELISFYERFAIPLPSDKSFPSGHAGASFSAAVALFMCFKQKRVRIPALVIASSIALSRIYLCVHYPSDVIVGALVGSACGVAGYFIVKYAQRFIKNKWGKPEQENKDTE